MSVDTWAARNFHHRACELWPKLLQREYMVVTATVDVTDSRAILRVGLGFIQGLYYGMGGIYALFWLPVPQILTVAPLES